MSRPLACPAWLAAVTLSVTVTTALPFSATASPVTGVKAQVLPCQEEELWPGWPDVDGDCMGDLVLGGPSWDAEGVADAGAIAVVTDAYGAARASAPLTSASFGFPNEPGAGFGAKLLVADLDGEDPMDLVVAAPGASEGGTTGAGAVYIVYGSASGLGAGKQTVRLTEASLGLPTQASHFGAALALWQPTQWEPEGPTRLVVGAPSASVDGAADAGRVALIDVASLQLGTVITQGHGWPGKPEAGDRFGATLSTVPQAAQSYLLVGAPYEDVGAVPDAGAVTIHNPRDARMFTQNSTGVPGAAEAGDHFGAAVTGIVGQPFGDETYSGALVSAPDEDLGTVRNAGAIVMFNLVASLDGPPEAWSPFRHMITADRAGFPGVVEAGDRLGSALDGNVIGVPYEDIGTAKDAGAICMISLGAITAAGSVPARCMSQNSHDVPGVSEAGDHFGQSFATLNPGGSDDPPYFFAVGTPGEDVGATADRGLVQFGVESRDSPGDYESMWNIAGISPQPGARWGMALH